VGRHLVEDYNYIFNHAAQEILQLRGTGLLWLRVYEERAQATTNLFETRLTFDNPRNVPKPLRPFFSGLEEGKTIRRAALATLLRKFKGLGAYEGL
jgi:hypothetical protein